MSREQLKGKLADFIVSDERKAAEIAYVLAVLYFRDGDSQQAEEFGKKSIELFEKHEADTLEQCAAHYTTIAGITLPSIIHAEVVRDRLKELAL